MEDQLNLLLQFAIEKQATDIHFVLSSSHLQVAFRTSHGLEKLVQDVWQPPLLEYLKFISCMDLSNPYSPQSGQFTWCINHREIPFRFSIIVNHGMQTGVLRFLYGQHHIQFGSLSYLDHQNVIFKNITNSRQGLIISSGPTGSGKTTTMHAILHEIALKGKYKVVTLEDPIEIEDPLYIQLQLNPQAGFTYDVGIEELLRHDPDVIFIGETRNAYTAKMLVRAALTGHLVFTTIHAKNGIETITRLLDLGVSKFDLEHTLSLIIAQRLYQTDKEEKQCIYEMVSKQEIEHILQYQQYSKNHETLSFEIQKAIENGVISDQQAWNDLQDL